MGDGSRGRRIRVIWNATAGSKAGLTTNQATVDEMRSLLARHGLGDELVESTSEEHARQSAREAAEAGYDLVVAAGGDGTVGMVADELVGRDAALGILPLGTVMNIARMLGLPRDLEGAAEILAHGERRTIDVGTADGRSFYETGSVGMNAAIFRESNRLGEGNLRSLARGIRIAFRYRPSRMILHLDEGKVQHRAMMVTVANGPYSGMGLTLAPDASLDDGLLDVRVFRHFSKLDLLRHTLSLALGRRPYSPHVTDYRSRSVRIGSHHPLPTRADSQDLGTTPVEFGLRPRALNVMAAAGAAGPLGSPSSHDAAPTPAERSEEVKR
ncbi:MAG: diacylglycerol kinase family lipid kinase [Chloroflexi bacterium]|nr:diacylglycerol kinase family lipid kinase [Chloroflexota bacterium]